MWYTFTFFFLPLSSWASQFTPFVSKSVQQLQHHHRKKTVSQGNPAHPKTDKTTPISTPAFPVPLPPCQLRLPPWPLRGGKPSPGFEDFQAKFKGEPHNSLLSAECFFAAFFFGFWFSCKTWPKPGGVRDASSCGGGRFCEFIKIAFGFGWFFLPWSIWERSPYKVSNIGWDRKYSGKSCVTHTRNGWVAFLWSQTTNKKFKLFWVQFVV